MHLYVIRVRVRLLIPRLEKVNHHQYKLKNLFAYDVFYTF